MFPPFGATVNASAAVKAIFGTTPLRIYPHGQAPQDVALPYAVFQTVTGRPANYLGDTPDADDFTLQIDVYASSVTGARDGAEAIRDAVEPVAYVDAWRGEFRDPETTHYRYSFDVAWMTPR